MGQFNEIVPYAYDCKEEGTLYVERQCPVCGRFLKRGTVKIQLYGDQVKCEGFSCSRCGEVDPDYFFGS